MFKFQNIWKPAVSELILHSELFEYNEGKWILGKVYPLSENAHYVLWLI